MKSFNNFIKETTSESLIEIPKKNLQNVIDIYGAVDNISLAKYVLIGGTKNRRQTSIPIRGDGNFGFTIIAKNKIQMLAIVNFTTPDARADFLYREFGVKIY